MVINTPLAAAANNLPLTREEHLILLGFTVALVVVHLLSSYVIHTLKHSHHGLRLETITVSLGGGVAVAYLFLYLLPKLDQTHPRLAPWNHLVMLGGLLLVLGLEHLAKYLAEQQPGQSEAEFTVPVHIGLLALYNLLIVYTIPGQLKLGLGKSAAYLVAMGLHLFGDNYFLEEKFPHPYRRWGRYVLTGAVVVGGMGAAWAPANKLVTDLLLATLAGFIILGIFREQLQEHQESSYPWFLTGAVVFGLLLITFKA